MIDVTVFFFGVLAFLVIALVMAIMRERAETQRFEQHLKEGQHPCGLCVRADGRAPLCLNQHPHGYQCNRPKNHHGFHSACGVGSRELHPERHPKAIWSRDEE